MCIDESDYGATTGTLEFPPGSLFAPLIIPIIDDLLPEIDEKFSVGLRTTDVAVQITTDVAEVTIISDDGIDFNS